jgi:hypothetical protein
VVAQIADAVDRTPAQVVLRWHVQLGDIAIPKSVTPARIEENLRVFDFELGAKQMRAIGALDRGLRTGPDPRTFGWRRSDRRPATVEPAAPESAAPALCHRPYGRASGYRRRPSSGNGSHGAA